MSYVTEAARMPPFLFVAFAFIPKNLGRRDISPHGPRRKVLFATMNIHTTTLARKPIDEAGERELLIHSLRTAVARSRLVTNTLETIGVSLRHKQVTAQEAMNWLFEEGLLNEVQIPLPRAPEAK